MKTTEATAQSGEDGPMSIALLCIGEEEFETSLTLLQWPLYVVYFCIDFVRIDLLVNYSTKNNTRLIDTTLAGKLSRRFRHE